MELRYERQSAFDHTLWDRFDLIRLVNNNGMLEALHNKQEEKFGYSAVQDGWYFLHGRKHRGSPAGVAWDKMSSSDGWGDLKEKFHQGIESGDDSPGWILEYLAKKFEDHFLSAPDTLPPEDDELEGEEPEGEEPEEEEEESPEEDEEPEEETTPDSNMGEDGEDEEQEPDDQEGEDGQDGESGDDGSGNGDEEEQEGDEGDQHPQEQEEDEGDTGDGHGEQEEESSDGQEDAGEEDGQGAESVPESGGPEDGTGDDGGEPGDGDISPDAPATVVLPGNVDAGMESVMSNMRPPDKIDVDEAMGDGEVKHSLLSLVGTDSHDPNAVVTDLISSHLDIKTILKFMGWSKRVVRGAKRKNRSASGELTGYKRGPWGPGVHPAEMIGVARMRRHSLIKFAEGQLSSRVYQEQKPKGRGPVILLRDESSSMQSEPHVPSDNFGFKNNHTLAQSFEIAMAKVMEQDDREFISLAWSSNGFREYTYGGSDVTLYSPSSDPDRWYDKVETRRGGSFERHMHSFMSGMTRLEPALARAVDIADEYLLDADILILTDGEIQTDDDSITRELLSRITTQYRDNPRFHSGPGFDEIVQDFRDAGGRVWALVLGKTDMEDRVENLDWVDGAVFTEAMGMGENIGEMMGKMVVESEQYHNDGRKKTRRSVV